MDVCVCVFLGMSSSVLFIFQFGVCVRISYILFLHQNSSSHLYIDEIIVHNIQLNIIFVHEEQRGTICTEDCVLCTHFVCDDIIVNRIGIYERIFRTDRPHLFNRDSLCTASCQQRLPSIAFIMCKIYTVNHRAMYRAYKILKWYKSIVITKVTAVQEIRQQPQTSTKG